MNRLFVVMTLCFFATALTPSQSSAGEAKSGHLEIHHAWARPALRTGAPVGAFLHIRNHGGKADRLLSASSSIAKKTELHLSSMTGGIMKMRQIKQLDVPADGMVALEPGSYHIMLMGVSEKLQVGKTFPLTLNFEHAGAVIVDMDIKKSDGHKHKSHDHEKMDHKKMDHDEHMKTE